mmetsp:Transcript_7139/g.29157  ORF Transcript_7139/g.29157 Transcript_7139/m.29157 type:complete len:221 (+) Transcript_7139:569-1231(+)
MRGIPACSACRQAARWTPQPRLSSSQCPQAWQHRKAIGRSQADPQNRASSPSQPSWRRACAQSPPCVPLPRPRPRRRARRRGPPQCARQASNARGPPTHPSSRTAAERKTWSATAWGCRPWSNLTGPQSQERRRGCGQCRQRPGRRIPPRRRRRPCRRCQSPRRNRSRRRPCRHRRRPRPRFPTCRWKPAAAAESEQPRGRHPRRRSHPCRARATQRGPA